MMKIEEETMIKHVTLHYVNLAYKIKHLWFCTVESSVIVAGLWMCGYVGCVFCALATTWVSSGNFGNYCLSRGRRY
jgi:hypothetical protein